MGEEKAAEGEDEYSFVDRYKYGKSSHCNCKWLLFLYLLQDRLSHAAIDKNSNQ